MKSLLFTYLLVLLLTSCGDSEKLAKYEEKVASLEKKSQEDSIFVIDMQREMDLVTNVLDTANAVNRLFKGDKLIEKQSALEKIQTLNTQLDSVLKAVTKLEAKVANVGSIIQSTPIIREFIAGKKIEVEDMKAYFVDLERQIERLKSDKVNLKKIIAEKEMELQKKQKELVEKDNIIVMIKQERAEQEAKLKEVEAKIAEADRLYKTKLIEMEAQTKKDKALILYQIAETFFDEYKRLQDKGALGKINTKQTRIILLENMIAKCQASYELDNNEKVKNRMEEAKKLLVDLK